MVAASLTNTKAETGLRPLNPLWDLGPLADLLEVAFADRLRAEGQSMVSDLRALRWISPLIWLLFHASAAFRAGLEGYVWVEGGRLVGNVSLSPAGGLTWSIGNVAVHPDYQGRGIARRLMEAAIDHVRALGGMTVLLEVHADNAPAVRLYEGLGFRRLDAVTDLRRPASAGFTDLAQPGLDLRPIPWHQWRKEYELALVSTPPGAWRTRPVRESQFRRSALGSLLERLSGRVTYRRGLFDPAGDLDAGVWLEMHRPTIRPHRLTLLIRPARQAELADALVAHAMRVLATAPLANVATRVHADPPHLVSALERHGFVAELTTARMSLDLRRRVPVQGR